MHEHEWEKIWHYEANCTICDIIVVIDRSDNRHYMDYEQWLTLDRTSMATIEESLKTLGFQVTP